MATFGLHALSHPHLSAPPSGVTTPHRVTARLTFRAKLHISNDGPEKPVSGRPASRKRALPVFIPPSTTIAVPVIQSASSLARNSAIVAMSSGFPARGIGCDLAIDFSDRSSAPGRPRCISGVLTPPGQLQLTRIL